jgi:hypothetical protein
MVEPTGTWLGVFLLVVAFCLVSLIAAIGWTARPEDRMREVALASVGVVAWLVVTSIPVGMGWITPENPLPWVPLQMIVLFAAAFGFGLSPLGHRVAVGVPLGLLVGFQGFRLPLELVLHAWAEQGVAPPQMTWTGQNVDIVAGIVALVLAPVAERSRAAAWVSQVVGIVLLANVLRVVVLSVPTPLRSFEVPLMLPFGLPTLWIATVCVCFAVAGHVVTVRRLLSR